MVARVQALSATAIAGALLVASGCAGTRVQVPPTAPSLPLPAADTLCLAPVPSMSGVHIEALEDDIDGDTLWALDRLLEDPVDLNRGALTRLLALPWLDRAHVEAIQRARPLGALSALAHLPGWDPVLVEHLAPFVRLGPHRERWTAAMRAGFAPERRVLTLRLETRAFTAGLRGTGHPFVLERGFSSLASHGLRVVVGDVGLSHAQGLLWWSSGSAVRASSAPLRRARGVFGVDGGAGTHGLRGAAVEVRARRGYVACAGGAGRYGNMRGAVGSLALARGHAIAAGWLQAQRTYWYSLGWSYESAGSQWALELAPRDATASVTIAAEKRRGPLRVGARLQRTPASALAPVAGIAAGERGRDVRHALVHAALRWARCTWGLSLAQGRRVEAWGKRTTNSEQRLDGRWSWPAQSLEVRLRQRRRRDETLDEESVAATAQERTRGVVLRYGRTLRVGTSLAVDYRVEEDVRAAAVASGSAWQVHLAHARRSLEAQVAFTSFTAPVAAAAPVVPEPGGGARRGVGDGLRVAAVLRLQTRVFDCSLRGAHTLDVDATSRPEWAVTVGLQLP